MDRGQRREGARQVPLQGMRWRVRIQMQDRPRRREGDEVLRQREEDRHLQSLPRGQAEAGDREDGREARGQGQVQGDRPRGARRLREIREAEGGDRRGREGEDRRVAGPGEDRRGPIPRRIQPARHERGRGRREGNLQGIPQPMENRAFLRGDEDVPGGEAGVRLRPRHHIRPFPGRVLLIDHNEADRIQGVRGQAAHRAALRLHPRLQGHREHRRRLRQQRDRHPDLPGD